MRVLFLAALILFPLSVRADGEKYFVMMYSYQNNGINAPAMSHTFATFVKMKDGFVQSAVDISWLPQPQYFRGIFRDKVPPLRPVPGKNYSLQETLGIAARNGYGVSPFGPYEITPQTFEAAGKRAADLSGGKYMYKMINGRSDAVNCILAVGGVVGDPRTGLKHGAPATEAVLDHFRRNRAVIGDRPDPEVADQIRRYINRRPVGMDYEPQPEPQIQPHARPIFRRGLLGSRRSH